MLGALLFPPPALERCREYYFSIGFVRLVWCELRRRSSERRCLQRSARLGESARDSHR